MVTRRRLLVTSGFVGATTLFAGCSGSEQPSESEEEPAETDTSDTEETEGGRLTNFSVGEISFSYVFSGLETTVELTNETEEGSGINTANIATEAYDGEELIGEDSEWRDFQATVTAEYELKIEELAQSADASLDDVTEVVILGQEKNEEPVELKTFSGDTVQAEIDG